MKIGVISCNRLPSREQTFGGLGKSAWDVAWGLQQRGHQVVLFAAPGSDFPGPMVIASSDEEYAARAGEMDLEVIFDYSHTHMLSFIAPGSPVLNCIGDLEAEYEPPNAVVASPYMAEHFPKAKIVNTGIRDADVREPQPSEGYLLFLSRMHPQKGWDKALRVANKAGVPIEFIGPGGEGFGLPNYHGAMFGQPKLDILSGAMGLLFPTHHEASPRVPLEAAHCGVPTLCLAGDGSSYHVKDGTTGFVCNSEIDMVHKVGLLDELDRGTIKVWAREVHGFDQMIDSYQALLQDLRAGLRW